MRRGVTISGGIYTVKNKHHPKIVARNIIVENVPIIVRAGKFKEKSVDVEIVQGVGILSENATRQGRFCHCYK